MQTIKRRPAEVAAVLERAMEAEGDGGTEYPGMTYEQGLIAMHHWLTEEDAAEPFEE